MTCANRNALTLSSVNFFSSSAVIACTSTAGPEPTAARHSRSSATGVSCVLPRGICTCSHRFVFHDGGRFG
jgi:hypothetical protein